ncbi:SRPBCC family protein [Aciditerrimonas ferrireducens]|uniref:SRPBCC family protein n=1 Tax=Aciditerrimonas ferrireducens TaxID=667306 RepID=UPI002006431F|nr:SRPBCC family protein [Aciditerrimonas ferrireducens]MCK4176737.1 SRPBCC family protein [Aciditerrimonas ferrireducens]
MELTNELEVPVGVDQAWAVLTDLERIAPCMPGAQLQEVVGDEYRGVVKVKVGPITAQYRGAARFVERNDQAHRAVLRAEGRDTRGQGTATATVTATLEPRGERTLVKLHTDLAITGKVAQFGRGVLADVSSKLLTQFAERLEHDVLAGNGAPEKVGSGSRGDEAAREQHATSQPGPGEGPAGTATSNGAPGERRQVPLREVEPVDLLETAGSPLLKRLLPLLGGVGLLGVVVALWRRRRVRRR